MNRQGRCCGAYLWFHAKVVLIFCGTITYISLSNLTGVSHVSILPSDISLFQRLCFPPPHLPQGQQRHRH